ncbi:MAG: gfo/Idh/MocA family oxidoreductase, partial [Candidatus Binatia bacterium]|nr:gfo/Idh/MocA family oxidoreductase [Candidatus Binatia bacterium]
ATDESHPFVEGWWPPGHLLGYEHSFTNTILDFLAAVATGSSPSPNFSDGRQNLQVLEAIERSSNSRHWEHVIAA